MKRLSWAAYLTLVCVAFVALCCRTTVVGSLSESSLPMFVEDQVANEQKRQHSVLRTCTEHLSRQRALIARWRGLRHHRHLRSSTGPAVHKCAQTAAEKADASLSRQFDAEVVYMRRHVRRLMTSLAAAASDTSMSGRMVSLWQWLTMTAPASASADDNDTEATAAASAKLAWLDPSAADNLLFTLNIKLTAQQLSVLRQFVTSSSGAAAKRGASKTDSATPELPAVSVSYVDEILSSAIDAGHVEATNIESLSGAADGSGWYSRLHATLTASLHSPSVIAILAAVTTVAVWCTVSVMRHRVTWYHLCAGCMFAVLLLSMLSNWRRLHQQRLTDRHVTLAMTSVEQACPKPGGRGWFLGLFSSASIRPSDDCLRYHQLLESDPLTAVSAVEVLSITLSQLVLTPMERLGEAMADFNSAIYNRTASWSVYFVTLVSAALFMILTTILVLGGQLSAFGFTMSARGGRGAIASTASPPPPPLAAPTTTCLPQLPTGGATGDGATPAALLHTATGTSDKSVAVTNGQSVSAACVSSVAGCGRNCGRSQSPLPTGEQFKKPSDSVAIRSRYAVNEHQQHHLHHSRRQRSVSPTAGRRFRSCSVGTIERSMLASCRQQSTGSTQQSHESDRLPLQDCTARGPVGGASSGANATDGDNTVSVGGALFLQQLHRVIDDK